MAYMDSAGLYQKYGTEQTVTAAGGEYVTTGGLREIEFKLDLTKLTATPTVVFGLDNVFMPAGMTIEQIEIIVETAGATGVSIDIGLTRTDRTTEIDWNGFIAAEVLATLTPAGKKIVYNVGTSKAGALLGASVGVNPGYITANSTSTLFTAGLLTVRIKYSKK